MSPRVATLLSLATGLTTAEFAELSLLAADQAGASLTDQREIARRLEVEPLTPIHGDSK